MKKIEQRWFYNPQNKKKLASLMSADRRTPMLLLQNQQGFKHIIKFNKLLCISISMVNHFISPLSP